MVCPSATCATSYCIARGRQCTQGTKKINMREIHVEKLCINICTSESGDTLNRASKVLKQLTGQAPFQSKATLTINTFGIRRGEEIATSVTVRGPKALELLERGLRVVEFQLPKTCFSSTGNFGFGVEEHIDLGIKYDPSIGIHGLNMFVVLGRKGTRVSRRRARPGVVGNRQRITPQEASKWFLKKFDGVLLERQKKKSGRKGGRR